MMTFDEVKTLLDSCVRSECRDHAFGDREIFWETAQGTLVAEGYSGGSGASVCSEADGDGKELRDFPQFTEKQTYELLSCGSRGQIDRNDATGPDTYQEGACMPGLTLAGVRKELVGE